MAAGDFKPVLYVISGFVPVEFIGGGTASPQVTPAGVTK